MVTDDLEFCHDKGGRIARSKDKFVAAIGNACERQRQATDFKARSRLVAASLHDYPMPKYGALQSGEHEVFRVEAGGRMIPSEHDRFTHLSKQGDDRRLLATAISDARIDGPPPGRGR